MAQEGAEMRRVRGQYTGPGEAWRGYLRVKRWQQGKKVAGIRQRLGILVQLIRELDDEAIKELLCEE